MHKILSLNNRKRQPLPARMEHGRSCLMDECQVMASDMELSPTIIIPALAPTSCYRKQASLAANDKFAPPFTEFFFGSASAVATAGYIAYVRHDFRLGS
jgi:hypothetical protein